MPKFRVTAPDGRTIDVEAPEGATPDQVLAYARQQSGPQRDGGHGGDRLALLLEAERRGILPPDQQAYLAEARKRGLVPEAPRAHVAASTGSQGRPLRLSDVVGSAAGDSAARNKRPLRLSDVTRQGLYLDLQEQMAKAAAGDPAAPYRVKEISAQLDKMRADEQAYLDQITGTSTNPTEGMSTYYRLMAGAGKSVADTGRGLAQLVGMGPSAAEVEAQRAMDAPLMDTGAGTAGNIAGQVGQMFALPGVGAAGRGASALGRAAPYVSAAAQGAAFNAAQPVGEDESRLENAATGAGYGLAGQGIASGLGKAATSAREALSPAVRQSIEAARKAGIPLNLSQVTASPALQALTSATRWLPFSGGAKGARVQQEAFNRAVGRTFGADASALTDDVMGQARKRLSSTFDTIYGRNNVEVGPDVVRRLAAIEREAFEDMTAEQAQVIRNQVDKVLREAGDGVMTGRKYQSLRTALQKAEQGGGSVGRLTRAVRTELDDAAISSVSSKDAELLTKVRSAWANLRTTEDALKQVAGAAGNVRPAALYPLIRKGATPEMRTLAKVGQNVLREGLGDSGTAQRAFYMNALGSMGAGVGLATGAPVVAKGLAVGALAGRALNSQVAAKALGEGRPINLLAQLARPAPKVLPVAAAEAPLDAGMVYGLDPNDPRYRGE